MLCFYIHSLLSTPILTRLAKRIIDALMSLNFDDQPCSAAAAALFYVLASDVSISFNLYIKVQKKKKKTLIRTGTGAVGSILVQICS